MVMHFNTTAERLKFLKHGYNEVIPVEAKEPQESIENQSPNEEIPQEDAEKADMKPKSGKKGKKKDEVQAE